MSPCVSPYSSVEATALVSHCSLFAQVELTEETLGLQPETNGDQGAEAGDQQCDLQAKG